MSTTVQNDTVSSKQSVDGASFSKSTSGTRVLHVYFRSCKNFLVLSESVTSSKQLSKESPNAHTEPQIQYYIENTCWPILCPRAIIREGSTKKSEPILGAAKFAILKTDVGICLGDPQLPSSTFELLERPKFFGSGKYGWSMDVGGERRRYQWRRTRSDRIKEEGGTKWSWRSLKLLDITDAPAELSKEEQQQMKQTNKERKDQGLEKEGERLIAMFLGNAKSFWKLGKFVIFEESIRLDEKSMSELQIMLVLTGCALVEKQRRGERWGSAGSIG